MKDTKKNAQAVYEIIISLNKAIDGVLDCQRNVRAAVSAKKWDAIEESMRSFSTAASVFSELDKKRESLFLSFCEKKTNDMYEIAKKMPEDLKDLFLDAFRELRQKLATSKIENKAIQEYVRITNGFLKGVVDSVIPQRRNKVYGRTGSFINHQPESVVLNTYM